MRIRTRWSSLIAVTVHLIFGAAHAQTDDVERYLTAAARLYENLEYERALEQLTRAKKGSRGMDDDIAIALYEGIILADMGKKEESNSAFKEGLFLNVDAKLPVKVSPKVERDFETVRADVKKEMAPILAKREAEKRAKEEQARLAEKRAADEKAAAEKAAAKAATDRAAADKVAADKAAADKARAQAQADKAAKSAGTQVAAKTPDAPTKEMRIVGALPAESSTTSGGLPPEVTDRTVEKKLPVAPLVLGGVALAAAGAGTYFGLQSRRELDAYHAAEFQSQAVPHWEAAKQPALIANILFAAAGTAAIFAVGTLIASAGDEPATGADATR